MAEREKLIELKDLQITFGSGKKKFVAVDHVNFDIYKGETFSLVGESGSGKTTIGRAICRINPTSGGDIFFKGQKINGKISKELDHEVIRKVQMIFQDPFSSLDPRQTVQDIIKEPMKLLGTMSESDLKDRTSELMKTAGIEKRLRMCYPHELDGGRRQRVRIARALALNPKFIVCDEPVSALDVTIQKQIMELMVQLQEELQLSILFISHDLNVIYQMCDRVLVMKEGRIVENAETEELFAHPQNDYTKELLAASPEL